MKLAVAKEIKRLKYRIHYAPSPAALEQAARVGSNMVVIYSVGPCSHLWFARDRASGREMAQAFPETAMFILTTGDVATTYWCMVNAAMPIHERLARDWSSYLLMQYGIERGVFPADRPTLGRMSRFVETFIRNLVRRQDTPAGRRARECLAFPDAFPRT